MSSVKKVCLICSSVISNQVEVDNSDCIFLLKYLLEIPDSQVELILEKVKYEEDDLALNHQLNWMNTCDHCRTSVQIAKQLYKDVWEVTKKFREVQKGIVQKILKKNKKIIPVDSFTRKFNECKNIITNYAYGEFGYPFIVRDLNVDTDLNYPIKTELPDEEDQVTEDDFIKEEVKSEDDHCDDDDEDDTQEKSEDLNPLPSPPPPPPPPPVNKPRSSKRKRKPVIKKPRKPRSLPLSQFARLHPEYTFIRNPTTLKFHCCDPLCSVTTVSKSNIEAHFQNIHLKKHKYICSWPDCYSKDPDESLKDKDGNPIKKKKSFASFRHYQVHMDRHKGTPRHKCDICNEQFYTTDQIAPHKQLVHEEIMVGDESSEKLVNLVCELCGKVLKYKQNLARHMARVHVKTPWKYQCHMCPKSYETPSELQIHLNVRHKDGKLEFKRQKKSITKLRNETTQCPVKGCRQTCSTPEGLKKHIENKHGGKVAGDEVELRYKCKWCGKGFHQKFKWQLHEEQHENKETRPYKCDLCGKGFSTMHNLKYHKKHTHKLYKKE